MSSTAKISGELVICFHSYFCFHVEEDAVHYFSTVFEDFEYDSYTHYFYVTSDTKPDISPVNKQLTGHVLAMVINDTSIITGVLTDVRFDGDRILTNDLSKFP